MTGSYEQLNEHLLTTRLAESVRLEGVRKQAEESGEITITNVRELFGTSRKYTLALLEYMDRQKITRRMGDERMLR